MTDANDSDSDDNRLSIIAGGKARAGEEERGREKMSYGHNSLMGSKRRS